MAVKFSNPMLELSDREIADHIETILCGLVAMAGIATASLMKQSNLKINKNMRIDDPILIACQINEKIKSLCASR